MLFLYKDRNLIFTTFSKNSPIFNIRKWKPRSEETKDSKEQNKDVFLSELDTELSTFDKIIQGHRDGIKVLYEDHKCIAFEDRSPVALVHFIVLAKDTQLQLATAN